MKALHSAPRGRRNQEYYPAVVSVIETLNEFGSSSGASDNEQQSVRRLTVSPTGQKAGITGGTEVQINSTKMLV